MRTLKPKPGETAAEYLKRCLAETDNTPITTITSITYQLDGKDTDPNYVTFNSIDFKSRKLSIKFDAVPLDPKFIEYSVRAAHTVKEKPEYRMSTISGTAVKLPVDELNMKYIGTDCRMKKMDVKLKRLLR